MSGNRINARAVDGKRERREISAEYTQADDGLERQMHATMCAARRLFIQAFADWLKEAKPPLMDANLEAAGTANVVGQLVRMHVGPAGQ